MCHDLLALSNDHSLLELALSAYAKCFGEADSTRPWLVRVVGSPACVELFKEPWPPAEKQTASQQSMWQGLRKVSSHPVQLSFIDGRPAVGGFHHPAAEGQASVIAVRDSIIIRCSVSIGWEKVVLRYLRYSVPRLTENADSPRLTSLFLCMSYAVLRLTGQADSPRLT